MALAALRLGDIGKHLVYVAPAPAPGGLMADAASDGMAHVRFFSECCGGVNSDVASPITPLYNNSTTVELLSLTIASLSPIRSCGSRCRWSESARPEPRADGGRRRKFVDEGIHAIGVTGR